MTGEKLKEFMRRLNAEGFQFELDDNGAGRIYRRGREAAIITDEGEIHYMPENRQIAYHIRDMREEVDEYMTAYQSAAQTQQTRFKTAPRTILEFNGAELTMRPKYDFYEFATSKRIGVHRESGNYFTDYAAAKEDFTVRAGLLNRNRLFTETELTVIRSNLSDFLQIDGGEHIEDSRADAIENVIRKIDTVVAPEIEKQQEREAIPEDEPEWEP